MIRTEDQFSERSENYAKFRPDYPGTLFKAVCPYCAGHELSWDCATGNGQAAIHLTQWFRLVIATDVSDRQVVAGKDRTIVRYAVARAERAPLPTTSVDLITVAQALHWFDLPDFFHEAGRVLRPGGLLAAWCYFLPSVNPEVDACVHRLYFDVLKGHRPLQTDLAQGRYEAISFPFREIVRRDLPMVHRWDLRRLTGYLGTWAGVSDYRARMGREPINEVLGELEHGWGNPDGTREVRWTISLRVVRK
jgi:SAM-dependent methyltransferase